MLVFFNAVHLLLCVLLILVILLQVGKGADMGAVFGGSSQTVFGTTGGTTFLTKLTVILAVLFVCSSVYLTLQSKASKSVIEGIKVEQKPKVAEPPANPENQPKEEKK